ncbi:hypothetical protein RvY_15444 [Ramazzottius varieornatus]|uniref:Transmembrane protein 60 n=1 Tax=Ramazzottius varieornatus TaxID=947166 RepID=A0A1D1W2Y4_RAMVA|nr:hypothetical protein RvY_15444 [Ramazzottius varieornatus]
MAFSSRGSFTWVSLVLLLVFVALRLDGRIEWNWFYVLFPAWIYESVMLIFILLQAITQCRQRPAERKTIIFARCWDACAVSFLLVFQVLLCLKLQQVENIPSYYVMFPLWLLLLQINAYLVLSVYAHERNYVGATARSTTASRFSGL